MSDPTREVRSTVGEEGHGMRLDRYLAEVLDLFPRSQIDHRDVHALVGGAPAKLSRRLHAGDEIVVSYAPPAPSAIEPEEIPLRIVFENDDVIVIDKPAGMVVHPAAGNWSGTLVQGLMYHVTSLADRFGDRARPGIVHRLDKETSGVIIAAKHPEALAALAAQFKRRETQKHYLALVRGQMPRSRGTIDRRLARDRHNRKRFAVTDSGGKEAVTEYRILRSYAGYSFVSLRPRTGRTHQLRVHMASIGCPIVGDPVYSRPDSNLPGTGLLLHAYELTIRLPGEDEPRRFTARLPERFRKALRAVSGRP